MRMGRRANPGVEWKARGGLMASMEAFVACQRDGWAAPFRDMQCGSAQSAGKGKELARSLTNVKV